MQESSEPQVGPLGRFRVFESVAVSRGFGKDVAFGEQWSRASSVMFTGKDPVRFVKLVLTLATRTAPQPGTQKSRGSNR